MIEQFAEGALMAFRFDTLVMIVIGLFSGMLVGALPGFTTLMAMAILLPLSFFLDPLVGIPFLLGVYKGGIFGGSIPAILVSMPGTGAAVATSIDGYKLTQKGESRKALDVALFSAPFSSHVLLFSMYPFSLSPSSSHSSTVFLQLSTVFLSSLISPSSSSPHFSI